MSFELRFEVMPGYLAARLIGDWVAEDLWHRYELLVEQCTLNECKKLLIDFRGAEITISAFQAYDLGKKSQIFAKHKLKVAGVGNPELVDPECFAELVARNRGVDCRAFIDVRAAEEWLLSG